MRTYLYLVLFVASTLLIGQATQFGLGLRKDSYTILGTGPVNILLTQYSL